MLFVPSSVEPAVVLESSSLINGEGDARGEEVNMLRGKLNADVSKTAKILEEVFEVSTDDTTMTDNSILEQQKSKVSKKKRRLKRNPSQRVGVVTGSTIFGMQNIRLDERTFAATKLTDYSLSKATSLHPQPKLPCSKETIPHVSPQKHMIKPETHTKQVPRTQPAISQTSLPQPPLPQPLVIINAFVNKLFERLDDQLLDKK